STTVTVQAVNGVATFGNLVINATGSYNLSATDGALPSVQSNPLHVVAQATRLVFTQPPNHTNAGQAVHPPVARPLEDGVCHGAAGWRSRCAARPSPPLPGASPPRPAAGSRVRPASTRRPCLAGPKVDALRGGARTVTVRPAPPRPRLRGHGRRISSACCQIS